MPRRNRGPAHAAELIDPEWQKQQLKDPSQSKTNFQKWARLMGDDTVGGWAKSKKAASKVAYGEDVLVKYYCARTAPPPRSSDPCASTAKLVGVVRRQHAICYGGVRGHGRAAVH